MTKKESEAPKAGTAEKRLFTPEEPLLTDANPIASIREADALMEPSAKREAENEEVRKHTSSRGAPDAKASSPSRRLSHLARARRFRHESRARSAKAENQGSLEADVCAGALSIGRSPLT
ncbi:MAG: hypothetical protein U0169_23410 [Polyangiaceae bacterium]